MNIAIIGTGYVGLVTGACLAYAGHRVVCIDNDPNKVRSLTQGSCPFFEPGLEDLVRGQARTGALRFAATLKEGVPTADVVMLAVGTPPDAKGAADVSTLHACARELARVAPDEALVVVKSTAPVGTCAQIQAILDECGERSGKGPRVASNPEFLAEGRAIEDFMRPERIVIGVSDERSQRMLIQMYRPIDPKGDRLLSMDVRSAEFAKYACNAMLAARISTVNELACIAGCLDADMTQACRVMGMDSRIGKKYLHPGAGYGGSCLPKDVQALISLAKGQGENAPLLSSVQAVNDRQVRLMAEAVTRFFDDELSGRRLAVWGLSFKPGTDDIRASPSVRLIGELIRLGARVQAYDPIASSHVRAEMPDQRLMLFPTAQAACQGADALIVMTEWSEFEHPDFALLASSLKSKAIFDGRRLYDARELRVHGLWHYVPGQRLRFPRSAAMHAAGSGTAIAQRTLRRDARPTPLSPNVTTLSQRSRP